MGTGQRWGQGSVPCWTARVGWGRGPAAGSGGGAGAGPLAVGAGRGGAARGPPGGSAAGLSAPRDWPGAGPPPPPLGQSPSSHARPRGPPEARRPRVVFSLRRCRRTRPARPLPAPGPGERRRAQLCPTPGRRGRLGSRVAHPPPRLHHPHLHAAEPGGRRGPSPTASSDRREARASASTWPRARTPTPAAAERTRGRAPESAELGPGEGTWGGRAVTVPSIDFSRHFGWETAVLQIALSRRAYGVWATIDAASGAAGEAGARGAGRSGHAGPCPERGLRSGGGAGTQNF